MPLLFFLTLYGAWWALPFSLCCLFLLHGFILLLQTNKEKNTNSTYTNIFSIKNIVFFLTFSVLLADFHLLSYLSPVPAPHPTLPHPHAPNLLSCCDKDRQFPRFLHHWAWFESICCHSWWSFFTETLENAVCFSQSRPEPLTPSPSSLTAARSSLVCLADDMSGWKYCHKVTQPVTPRCVLFLFCFFKATLRFSSVL